MRNHAYYDYRENVRRNVYENKKPSGGSNISRRRRYDRSYPSTYNSKYRDRNKMY